MMLYRALGQDNDRCAALLVQVIDLFDASPRMGANKRAGWDDTYFCRILMGSVEP